MVQDVKRDYIELHLVEVSVKASTLSLPSTSLSFYIEVQRVKRACVWEIGT